MILHYDSHLTPFNPPSLLLTSASTLPLLTSSITSTRPPPQSSSLPYLPFLEFPTTLAADTDVMPDPPAPSPVLFSCTASLSLCFSFSQNNMPSAFYSCSDFHSKPTINLDCGPRTKIAMFRIAIANYCLPYSCRIMFHIYGTHKMFLDPSEIVPRLVQDCSETIFTSS